MGLSLFLFGIGILTIGIGFNRLRKPFSAWFLAKTPYTMSGAWSGIPLGIGAILWGIAFLPFISPSWARTLLPIGLIIGLIGPFIMYIFFKPTWLKWLEQEHSSIVPFLENEVVEVGFNTLDKHIKSHQDLEKWVKEVQHKIKQKTK